MGQIAVAQMSPSLHKVFQFDEWDLDPSAPKTIWKRFEHILGEGAYGMSDWGPIERLSRTLDLFHLYRIESRKCKEAGAHLAGCVLLGSALEAALLAMVQCFPPEVGNVASRFPRELSRPPSEWSLSQLLLVARELGWLPTASAPSDRLDPSKAEIGDYAEVVRAIRNLLHPSIYLRECPDKAISQGHLEFSFRVLDEACSCLHDALAHAQEIL
jgi:hypothetical protein